MTIVLSFVVLAIVMAAMAIGVIVANKPIRGSCGGMSAIGIDKECDICGGSPKKCEDEQERKRQAESGGSPGLAYDAGKK